MTLPIGAGTGTRRAGIAVAIGLAVTAVLLALAGPAAARTVPVYTYTGDYYDGTGSTAGTLATGQDVAINQSNGKAYVADPVRLGGSISQFDAEGNPLPFSALEGATAIPYGLEGGPRVAVDNSSAASKGNIYVLVNNGASTLIKGWRPDGTEIGENFPIGGLRVACGLAVDAEGDIWGVDYRRALMVEYSATGAPTGKTIAIPPIGTGQENGLCDLAIDADDNFYLTIAGPTISYARKFDPEGNPLYDIGAGSPFSNSGLGIDVDVATGHVFLLQPTPFQSGEFNTEVVELDQNGEAITAFGAPDPAHSFEGFSNPASVAVGPSAEEIYVPNGHEYGGVQHVEIFAPTAQAVVPTTKTEPPELEPTSVTLKGTVDLDGGGDATTCRFEWGTDAVYGQTAACVPAAPISGVGVHAVTAQLAGLTKGAKYHYRVVTENGSGILAIGRDRAFRPQGPAGVSAVTVSDVNTDGARISAAIDPNGGDTSYRVEYGLEDCDLSTCAIAPLPEATLLKTTGVQAATVLLSGLQSDVTYHYRLVATNSTGETLGVEDTFRTYDVESTVDECANTLIRREMAAVLLPDCRAYELVSAAEAGGYDVLSDLIPGQVPYAAKPGAHDRLLYSLNAGKLPGVSGEPTNNGYDPYLATRTASGWTTAYAGIPVGAPPSQPPFSSTALAESDDLSTLAFGGPDVCDPCFADGKTGIPVRRDGGPVAQGMAGSVDPGSGASADGYVGRRLSADGNHLIFGSTSAFEGDAAGGGDVSIYDRNLATGVTHVVSKTPAGANLPCLQGAGSCHAPGNGDGIASLDVSADGSRIVVANRVATDSAGNRYWHPYMNIGDSGTTVDLAPGAAGGVIFDGMSADGSAVLYTTSDPLTADDHDISADIYRADVSGAGTVDLTRVSSGSGGGDTNACNPVPAAGNNWNAPGAASPNRCGAVAFAGGAGVARGSGAIFFLSPERLDGVSGVVDEPNLYVSRPGAPAEFIATLEPTSEAIQHAVYDSEASTFGDIQVAPGGEFAAFASDRPLTGFPTFGHTAIYRYAAAGEKLTCASCPTTRASLTADTRLSRYGLNLADDGRVFFTSAEPVALRDTGDTSDVYEWNDGVVSMLSTGRSQTESGLLSVSADGVDAFFYTRETLVSGDRNGKTIKVYTAREGGGFSTTVVPKDCQASDECHGPGSAAPPVDPLPTFQGSGGNFSQPAARKKRKKHRRKHRHRHGGKHRANGGVR